LGREGKREKRAIGEDGNAKKRGGRHAHVYLSLVQ